MIRINLLPHKKKKAMAVSVEGEKTVAIGFGILFASVAAVFFMVHSPMQDDIENIQQTSYAIQAENQKIEQRTAGFDALKAAFQSAKAQAQSIATLNAARATPANFLFELATIMKERGKPTITAGMDEQLLSDENLRWDENWDPKHVWITSLSESNGSFTLLGKAQSDGDVTQLTHRLAASVYFDQVQPEGSTKGNNKGGLTIYNFRITGKVRY